MADDLEQQEQEQETQVEETVETETPEPDAEVEAGDPHPLEPGGKRFSEVYRDMKDARREAQELRDRISRLEGAQSVQPQPRQEEPQERFFSADELQALVDAGKISPAKMADQLAWQRTTLMQREITQRQQADAKVANARGEIVQYVKAMPALNNQSSPEFQRAFLAAREIADELGRSVDDPIVQRRALRETFGSVEKLGKVKQVREDARRNADTHTERPGGARQSAGSAGADQLRGVPQRYLDHWKRLGYSKEQMVEESKYLKRGR